MKTKAATRSMSVPRSLSDEACIDAYLLDGTLLLKGDGQVAYHLERSARKREMKTMEVSDQVALS
jgi:hypothetical protein